MVGENDFEHETDMVLRPGVYGIFFPNDIHRPGCVSGEPGLVKKNCN